MSDQDLLHNPELRQVMVVIGKHLVRDQVRIYTAVYTAYCCSRRGKEPLPRALSAPAVAVWVHAIEGTVPGDAHRCVLM